VHVVKHRPPCPGHGGYCRRTRPLLRGPVPPHMTLKPSLRLLQLLLGATSHDSEWQLLQLQPRPPRAKVHVVKHRPPCPGHGGCCRRTRPLLRGPVPPHVTLKPSPRLLQLLLGTTSHDSEWQLLQLQPCLHHRPFYDSATSADKSHPSAHSSTGQAAL
jgi:hypothetical protein